MGWYDAFKGQTQSLNLSGITSDTGSAAKSFGDAFKDIGKSIVNNERAKENSKLNALKMQNEDNKLTKYNADLDQKSFDDAFSKDLKLATNADAKQALTDYAITNEDKHYGDISVPALADAFGEIKKADNEAQAKHNSKAIKASAVGDYADVKKFIEANPELVENADDPTITKIDKYFSDKSTAIARLNAKEKDVKHATALSKMEAKVVKANATNTKNAFKYTEQTDAKIASQVKTAMGMDAPDFKFDDIRKKEYQDTVAGSSRISKKYSLAPSIAIHVYQNPDLYEFTADGKVLVKKQVEATKEPEDRLNILKK